VRAAQQNAVAQRAVASTCALNVHFRAPYRFKIVGPVFCAAFGLCGSVCGWLRWCCACVSLACVFVRACVCSRMFACACVGLCACGRCYTWGGGEHGQLGHGDKSNRLEPHLVCMCMCVCLWVVKHCVPSLVAPLCVYDS
jgi:hypothetical protein